MTYKNTSHGFTLIELLVAVIIIAILAAIAVPKYNKAVQKVRLSEVNTTFSSISKDIDIWLLSNGLPSNSVQFSGSSNAGKLDFDPLCATQRSSLCYTKVGRWAYGCVSDNCYIRLETAYEADTSFRNKWLNESEIYFYKYPNQEWKIDVSKASSSVLPDICRWWKELYGTYRFKNNACDDYLY